MLVVAQVEEMVSVQTRLLDVSAVPLMGKMKVHLIIHYLDIGMNKNQRIVSV